MPNANGPSASSGLNRTALEEEAMISRAQKKPRTLKDKTLEQRTDTSLRTNFRDYSPYDKDVAIGLDDKTLRNALMDVSLPVPSPSKIAKSQVRDWIV